MWWVLGYLVFGAVSFGAWYLYAVRAHRKRAVQVLHWIENALDGHGHVTGIQWISPSEFAVPVKFVSRLFHNASVLVRFQPFEEPLRWAWQRWKQDTKECITFRADLDCVPLFSMQMQNLRWFARSRKKLSPGSGKWTFEVAQPFLMTTRMDWQKEITSAFNSVLSCEQKEFLELSFRRQSPHFTATVPLETIAPSCGAEANMFHALREIALSTTEKAS
jgi:hypothetical protein